jgi:outer membrane protein assembly factor BamB
MRRISSVLVCVTLFSTASLRAQWPQWRGPSRDGVVASANVPASWPEKPTIQWTVKAGEGYSTPVVGDGRVFLHSRQEPDEVVTALDLASGTQLWTARYPASFAKNKYASDMSKGPFSTPLVAGGIVYTLGTSAVLSAFDASSGALKWRKDWSKEIDTSRLFTGTAMSPIMDGGLLVVHVGDDGDGAFRALDPATGAERWTLPGHGPGYASPVVATFGGIRQLVTMTDKAVVGVGIADGQQLWTIPFADEWNENIVTPVVVGDLLVVSGIRKGTFGYRVEKGGSGLAATQVWHNTDVPMYMSSPVADGSFLYGFSSKRKGQMFCLDARSGTVKWTTEGRGGTNATIQSAGPYLVVLTTDGDMTVVRRDPEKFVQLHRYKLAESQTWAQPVLLKDSVIVRSADAVTRWKF